MPSINRVILIGTLGKDPEIKPIGEDKQVVNFGLATSRFYKDQNGNKQEEVEWHKCCAFGKLASVISTYCTKGSVIFVEGHLQTRKYDKNGVETYTTNVVVDSVQLLGGKKKSEESSTVRKSAQMKKASADPDDVPF